jgi:hypothetical protein
MKYDDERRQQFQVRVVRGLRALCGKARPPARACVVGKRLYEVGRLGCGVGQLNLDLDRRVQEYRIASCEFGENDLGSGAELLCSGDHDGFVAALDAPLLAEHAEGEDAVGGCVAERGAGQLRGRSVARVRWVSAITPPTTSADASCMPANTGLSAVIGCERTSSLVTVTRAKAGPGRARRDGTVQPAVPQ